MIEDEDILEHVLTFGKQSTILRFSIDILEVERVVNSFVEEVSLPCMCEQSRRRGIAIMCFYCTGREMSLSLKQRIEK